MTKIKIDNDKILSAQTFDKIGENTLSTTPEKLELFIKQIVTTSIESTRRWFEKETVVSDKITGEEIKNCEIRLIKNPKSLMKDYVEDDLKKLGISYIID